ncbi:hypothetical protein SBRCBS47491_006850 [Sporothrix bragantina]|uniref:ubiquitinyl hydrolase 1 n=1 Tax=Sporothrix bragantina TaxID=671064 RepID=A0ABP0C9H1_9PEZI
MADSALPKADTNQAAIDAEIAAQEAAARDYRPDVNGPGINEIRSTEEIKDHYACADHIFVQKTVNLPRAYPLYRAVRGDGNCGWRAIGFCYFEALIHNGNAALIAEEKQRLLGLNDYIREVGGYDPYVYEDMVEETDILFEAILKALPDTEQAIRTLTDSFNDEGAGNAIIYHLRLLTASYLKGNVETYEGFIAHDGGVIGYCQEWIERPNCEIDHLRVEVLASILLKPSDIVLEIAYLDRSHGSNVTVYKFPDTNIGRLEETITMRISLLFRPDHYDILYRPSLPSRAVAEAVLLRFLPADAAMAALQPSVDMSVTGALPEQQPANDVPNPLVTSYLPAESVASDLVTQTFPAPTRYYDRIAQQVNTPSIPEDTPDLTPGSSSNSPAMFPVKEEPVTPAYASPAPPNVGQQQIASVHREVHGQGAASSVAGVAPTSTSGTSNNASVAKQGPTSAALSTPHPAPPPRSVHDRDVHHVGSVSYGGASQSIGRMGNFHSATSSNFQLLAHLPGMFGRFQTQPMSSSPLGPGPSSSWNVGAPGPSGFHKEIPSFSVSPVPPTSGGTDVMPSNSVPAVPASPVPSVIPGTPMSAGSHMDRYSDSYSEPAFSTAGTPGPMMEVPTPIPAAAMPYTGHTSHPVSQTGGGVDANNNGGPSNVSFLPEPKSTPVRFTKWHFNRLPHDATDPNSSLFRNSRVSTAHFDNPDFQPQEYDPSGGGGDAPSSRNRRKSSVLREYDDKKR